MTELEDLARVREFAATLEHGERIECKLRRIKSRQKIVTNYDRTIMMRLIERAKDHFRLAAEIGSSSRNVIVALGKMSARGIVETIDGEDWRLTEMGRASMMTPMEKS